MANETARSITLYLNKRVNITHGEHSISIENSSKVNDNAIILVIIGNDYDCKEVYERSDDGVLVKVGEIYE